MLHRSIPPVGKTSERNNLLPPLSQLEKDGWKLVRHCPQGNKWHRARDHLRGTEVYGDPAVGEDPSGAEWSVDWSELESDQFLFATGDHVHWMVVDKTHLLTTTGFNAKLTVLSSSVCPNPHTVRVHNQGEKPHEPAVSLVEDPYRGATGGFLYGGASWDVTAGTENGTEGRTESGRTFGDSANLAAACGGANVFVRLSKKTRCGPGYDSLGMSLLRALQRASSGNDDNKNDDEIGKSDRADSAAAEEKKTADEDASITITSNTIPGSPVQAAERLLKIRDRAEGKDDASLMLLWAHFPRIFFFSLVRVSFYRHRVYNWLQSKVNHMKRRNVDSKFYQESLRIVYRDVFTRVLCYFSNYSMPPALLYGTEVLLLISICVFANIFMSLIKWSTSPTPVGRNPGTKAGPRCSQATRRWTWSSAREGTPFWTTTTK